MIPAALPVLAAAEAEATGPDTVTVLLGFLFVIVVLAFLWIMTQIIGLFFAGKKEATSAPAVPTASSVQGKKPAPAVATATTSAAATVSETDDGQIVALIAAAVHATLGEPHRIISIKNLSASRWATEGRREISRSHKVR